MASAYPGALDTLATDKTGESSMAGHAVAHNDLADAINKIEAELGVNPSGAAATVVARLNDISGSSSVLNVQDFGAVGDNTTDDAAAIQAAIDACDPNRGGTVFFPQGRYRISETLEIAHQGTWLVGEGSIGTATEFSLGSSRIVSDDGVTAISCAAAGHATLGYGFRNLHVVAASGATTGNGILVTNAEKTIVENVCCSDYPAGYGMRLAGGAGNAQYAQLTNFASGNCLTGLHLSGTGPNGLRMFGGYLEGHAEPDSGSVAIHIETGDTARIFGAIIAGWETGIYVESQAVGHQIFGARFEYCNIGVRFGGSSVGGMLVGCDFDNTLLEGSGSNVGIQVDSGADNIVLLPGWMSASVTTKVSDAGTDTLYWTNNGTQPLMFLPGTLGVNGATTTQMGGGVGVLAFKNADTNPGSNPTGGGVLYVDAGALKYRGASGTVTPLADA